MTRCDKIRQDASVPETLLSTLATLTGPRPLIATHTHTPTQLTISLLVMTLYLGIGDNLACRCLPYW